MATRRCEVSVRRGGKRSVRAAERSRAHAQFSERRHLREVGGRDDAGDVLALHLSAPRSAMVAAIDGTAHEASGGWVSRGSGGARWGAKWGAAAQALRRATTHSVVPRTPCPLSHSVPPLSRHAIQRSQRWRDVPELALSKQSTALAALNALPMNRNRTSVDMDITVRSRAPPAGPQALSEPPSSETCEISNCGNSQTVTPL